jgi:multidrug efflux pump subunit AcrA (membrane-fusion protein)
MSMVAVSTSFPVKRRIPWLLAALVSLVAVGVFAGYVALTTGHGADLAPGQFYTVVPMDMDITITKDGELQAVKNIDIQSPVEGQNVILDIATEGDYVHKGDVVCKIDSTDIERKIETATLDLQTAESNLAAAREGKEIQESTNVANLEAANVDLTLARLDLEEYLKGTYPSDLQTAQTNVEMAQIAMKNKEDILDQTRSLFSKGFVTAADVKNDELALLTSKNDLAEKTTAREVLEKYTHEKEMTDKKNTVAQAERKLARVKRENASNMAQKVSDLQSKSQTLVLRKQQFDHLQEQLAACTIKAPGDGMVVYSSSGSGSWGRRDTPIQPGAQVRQQELIIRLPDTGAMKAVARIQEGQVSKLRVDPKNPMRAIVNIVGQPEPLGAWVSNISIMADSSQRWFSPDTKEYPVDITLDHTPKGLKPGLSVEVKIFIDRLHDVLAVPLASVYAAGEDSYVFTQSPGGPLPMKVALGAVNDTHAQIKQGISAGQNVLILQAGQGRDLLEKAGIKVEPKAIDDAADKAMKAPAGSGPAKPAAPAPAAAHGAPAGDSSRKKDPSAHKLDSSGHKRENRAGAAAPSGSSATPSTQISRSH